MNLNFKIILTILLFWTMQMSFAQNKEVSGTVTDQNNVPLPGVNVTIQGTSSGTSTDFDGNYTLSAAEGDILIFSSVGFSDIQKTVEGENTINVVLEEDSQALEEVVVTAFGRKLTRNETTASVTSVSSDEITKHTYTSATQSLQGNVSGLTLNTPSGTPGSSPEIRIRGINSITASNAPLIILDGMPIVSGDVSSGAGQSSIDILSLINPSDIEEMSVLKDASAVAPYGADGANGVILINTKEGKKGKTRYNLTVSGGFQNFTKPGHKMASSNEMWDAMKEGLWNARGEGSISNPANPEIFDRSDQAMLDYAIQNNIGPVDSWVKNGQVNTDWRDVVTNKDAFIGDVNFSMSQATEKNSFYASLGYNKTDGVLLGSDFKRWSGFIKYDTELNDRMNLKISAMVANANQNGASEFDGIFSDFDNPLASIYLMPPFANIYNEDGTFNVGPGSTWYDFGTNHNMPYMTKHNIRNTDIIRALPNAQFEWEIIDDLTFRTLLGLDYSILRFKNYQNTINSSSVDEGGSVEKYYDHDYHYTTQNMLDYRFTLGEKNNFNATIIQEFNKYKTDYTYASAQNMANDILTNLSAASAGFDVDETFSDQIAAKYVGLLNYNYDEKYLLNASYSYQGDSRFSTKFGNFYSLGLGWNLHKENFLSQTDWINELRLKLGYGLTGNAGIDRNQFQELFGFQRYNDETAFVLTGYGSTTTWEKSRRMDVSVDYSLFNNRLSGTLGVFMNKTYDMLLNVPLPYSAQFKNPDDEAQSVQNIGEMVNNGFEFSFNAQAIKTSDFSLDIYGNFSTLNNYVSSLESSFGGDANDIEQGRKVNEWFMPVWAGVDEDNGLPLWYVDPDNDDYNTTSTFAEAQRSHSGKNMVPTYTGALGLRAEWKNIFVEGQFYFEGGHQIYDHWAKHTEITDSADIMNGAVTERAVNNAWREGQPHDGRWASYYPRFDQDNNAVAALSEISTRNLYDATNIKLRDIAIGYTLRDENITDWLGIDNLSFSIRGQNLWTWLKDKRLDFDPSGAEPNGRILMNVPPVKQITFNLNVNF